MELPTKPKTPLVENPKFMVIFSRYKSGKTTALSLLEDNLLIDLEDGSDFVGGMTIKADNMTDIRNIVILLQEKLAKGERYKYITLDTATALEDITGALAIQLYQGTAMGSKWGKPDKKTGKIPEGETDVKLLPNGAGYLYLRKAFEMVINMFKKFPSECLILSGHVADKMIERNGKEISEMQLDLTGKLSPMTCAKADAVGFLYRQGNECVLNFEGGGNFLVEARSEHLRGKKIVLSERLEDGTIKTNWDKIFI